MKTENLQKERYVQNILFPEYKNKKMRLTVVAEHKRLQDMVDRQKEEARLE